MVFPFGSDDLVVARSSLAVTFQRRRLEPFIGFIDPLVDDPVLLLEQAVAVDVALDQEWAEILNNENPHRLGNAELVQPMDIDMLVAATKQCAGAIAGSGRPPKGDPV